MASQELPSHQLRLEDVIIAFEEWRSGPRPRQRIPEALWDKAIALLSDYPESKVRKSLGINKQQLHKKLESRGQSLDHTSQKCLLPQAPTFVRTIVDKAEVADPYRCDLLLSRTDGTELQIKQLSQQDALLIAQKFLKKAL